MVDGWQKRSDFETVQPFLIVILIVSLIMIASFFGSERKFIAKSGEKFASSLADRMRSRTGVQISAIMEFSGNQA